MKIIKRTIVYIYVNVKNVSRVVTAIKIRADVYVRRLRRMRTNHIY